MSIISILLLIIVLDCNVSEARHNVGDASRNTVVNTTLLLESKDDFMVEG